MRQNRSEADRLGADVVDNILWHNGEFRNVWKSHIILAKKNLGVFSMIIYSYT
ncbi:hypothetical protein DESC_250015 [Desulfosarcina cetonica]|nr:hypothetical protein DESC_250015 [Desulfosarcina cetonica]